MQANNKHLPIVWGLFLTFLLEMKSKCCKVIILQIGRYSILVVKEAPIWHFSEENVDGDTKFVILTSFEGRPPLALVGNTICYCNRPGMTIKLRSTEKGHAEQGELQGHHKIITAMEARGTLLYTGGYDNTVKIWDVPTKKLIASGTTVSSSVQSLTVGDDGSIYAGLMGGYVIKMQKQ